MFRRIVATVVAGAGLVAGACGQGTVDFDTSAVGAPVTNASPFGGGLVGAVVPQGTNFFAQLYALAGTGQSSTALLPVGRPVNFDISGNAGYVQVYGTNTLGQQVNQTVTITNGGVLPGGPVTVQLRAWWGGGTRLTNYEAAVSQTDTLKTNLNARYGQSPVINLSATGDPTSAPPGFPADLTGLHGFQLRSWYTSTLPAVAIQPSSLSAKASTTASFTVEAIPTPLSYQWSKNGVGLTNGGNVSGVATATLTVSNVLKVDEGTYRVVVTNSSGSVSSSNATLTVVEPAILVPPASRTNAAGTTASFTVNARGTAPLRYQWKKGGVSLANGGNVSGATTNTLTLTNVQDADAANYTVVVTNTYGSVTSSPPAALTVIHLPVITLQPADSTRTYGTTATFTVSASGTPPLSYQWQEAGIVNLVNDDHISGANSPTLTISNVWLIYNDTYDVVVSNAAGSVVSSSALLTVLDPAITSQPASRTNVAGTTATFVVGAIGYPPLSYQWSKDGANLANGGNVSGATSSTLMVSNVIKSSEGVYSVMVLNGGGFSVFSSGATLTVPDPAINAQPASRTNNAGSTATFTASASGTAPLSYRWRKGGVALNDGGNTSGAATATLTLSNVLKADEGSYSFVVSNRMGSVTSSNATLTVIEPAITTQPANQAVAVGSNATFTVGAAGTALQYQWRRQGTNLPGALGASLVITNVSLSNSGQVYSVVVSNTFGSLLSSNALLIVGVPPVITTQPRSQIVTAGSNVTLTVAATGTPPPVYQWFLNSSSLAGAVGTSLTITNFQSLNQGNYIVRVTNVIATVFSASAGLYLPGPFRFVNPQVSSDGFFQARLVGLGGSNCIVSWSTNLATWTPMFTNNSPGGVVDFTDTNKIDLTKKRVYRIYRARLAP